MISIDKVVYKLKLLNDFIVSEFNTFNIFSVDRLKLLLSDMSWVVSVVVGVYE